MKPNKNKMKMKHKVALFIVYFTLFAVLSTMVDYYAYDLINPWLFAILSVVGAVWATVVHVKSKDKSKVDELAHDVEEII